MPSGGYTDGTSDFASIISKFKERLTQSMVLIGGMGTIAGPMLGALVLFGLQEALSSYGAWYLVIVGGLAVAATLVSSRGLWGFAADRYGWSLLPVGYRVRPPRG